MRLWQSARRGFTLRSKCPTEEPRLWRTRSFLHSRNSLRSWSKRSPATGERNLRTGARSSSGLAAKCILPIHTVRGKRARMKMQTACFERFIRKRNLSRVAPATLNETWRLLTPGLVRFLISVLLRTCGILNLLPVALSLTIHSPYGPACSRADRAVRQDGEIRHSVMYI